MCGTATSENGYRCRACDAQVEAFVKTAIKLQRERLLQEAAPELFEALRSVLEDSGALESPGTTSEMRAVTLIRRIEGA